MDLPQKDRTRDQIFGKVFEFVSSRLGFDFISILFYFSILFFLYFKFLNFLNFEHKQRV